MPTHRLARVLLFTSVSLAAAFPLGCSASDENLTHIFRGRTLEEDAATTHVHFQPAETRRRLQVHPHGLPGVEGTGHRSAAQEL